MENYKLINEFISKINSGEIDAANSIKELISSSNFKNNIATLDKIFFENKLKSIDAENHAEIISFIQDVHKIKSGNYNDFNIWSSSKTHLNKTNKDLINQHHKLNERVGFPDNGNGLYKSFLGNKNLLKFIKNKYNLLQDTKENTNYSFNLLVQFNESCKYSGLTYHPQLITRYITSLATKPFVILTGLSGSGKTKLAQAFSQWISEDSSQYCIVPVGADWTNREPLLGYVNALDNSEYILPENGALNLLIEANKKGNSKKPYFLILDEMNLSHVERYFADFLSVMESKDQFKLHSSKENLNVSSNYKNKDLFTSSVEVPSSISWPTNLFVIGTVNIDETTYMFSPKVLDRANVIEFRVNKEEITSFLTSPSEIDMDKLNHAGESMGSDFLKTANNKLFEDKDTTELNTRLIKFFEELQKTGAEFGYRSASEIHRLYNQLSVLDKSIKDESKIDIAIMQKLLPKLHGSRRKLCPTLEILASLCVKEGTDVSTAFLNNKEVIDYINNVDILYPLSLEKITRMYQGAIDNGFASYAEA
ncbi:MAG: hypothetical protein WCY77_04465 [Weeksellaceae bacterium]